MISPLLLVDHYETRVVDWAFKNHYSLNFGWLALIFKSFKQISVSLQVIITPEKIDGSIGCR